MFGGLEGTEKELQFIDSKMYPRRKHDPLKKLREFFTDKEILEWLVRDIMKAKKKRTKKIKIVDEIPEEESAVILEEEHEDKPEVKKRGRKPKYLNDIDRKKAKLEQTLKSNKKKREEKKKLNKK
jgi:hypothetical protein